MNKKHKISKEDSELFRDTITKSKPVNKDKLRAEEASKASEEKVQLEKQKPKSHPRTVASDQIIEFARSGIQHKIQRRLYQGLFAIDAKIDLHNMTVAEADSALEKFLENSINKQARCVLVIHGKGYRGSREAPKLKNNVNSWLRQWVQVQAFCSAKPKDGGAGALYVLLKQ